MTDNLVALMAKLPMKGKVKTRLASEIGDSSALEVYISLLRNVITNCLPSDENNFELGCFIEPGNRRGDFQSAFPGFSHYFGQTKGDLGERMYNALIEMFEGHNVSKALLIGADIPDLDRTIITKAFTKLDHCDIVFGPTTDGGYYLVAMNQLQQGLFTGVEWGSHRVLKQSLSRANSLGLRVELLKELGDLDTIADLKLFPDLAESAGLSIDSL